MKRYGYHHVDLSLCCSEKSMQAICQVPAEEFQVAELEAVNDRIEWWLVGPSREYSIQGRRRIPLGLDPGSLQDYELALAATAQSQGQGNDPFHPPASQAGGREQESENLE